MNQEAQGVSGEQKRAVSKQAAMDAAMPAVSKLPVQAMRVGMATPRGATPLSARSAAPVNTAALSTKVDALQAKVDAIVAGLSNLVSSMSQSGGRRGTRRNRKDRRRKATTRRR